MPPFVEKYSSILIQNSGYKVAIFVHGCFGMDILCRAGHLPSSNLDYWKTKIEANIERDNRKINNLKTLGWKVITIWQCEIKALKKREAYFSELIPQITNEP